MYPSLIASDQRRLRKTLHKQTDKQTDRQTDGHYENNGHLAVNQKDSVRDAVILIVPGKDGAEVGDEPLRSVEA